jgi:hypothetical protein
MHAHGKTFPLAQSVAQLNDMASRRPFFSHLLSHCLIYPPQKQPQPPFSLYFL